MVNFIKRWATGIVMLLLLITSRMPSHTLRIYIYRYIFRVKMGSGVTIYSGVEMRSPWKISIDDNSVIGNYCLLDGRRGLKIGKNVNVSSGVWIWTLHHDAQSSSFEAKGSEVVIEDYVWLCSRSTLLPGVHVKRGAIVASSAVVVKCVDEFSIVGGVPAKKIGDRNKSLDYKLDYRIPFI